MMMMMTTTMMMMKKGGQALEAVECGEKCLHVHGSIATERRKSSQQLRKVQVSFTRVR
jgi:hypothetical protein